MKYIEKNPLDNVTLVKIAKTLEDIQRIENKFLEKDEIDTLLNEPYRRPSTYRTARLAEFMYLTGASFEEAMPLSEKDFNLKDKLVSITGSINRNKDYKKIIRSYKNHETK